MTSITVSRGKVSAFYYHPHDMQRTHLCIVNHLRRLLYEETRTLSPDCVALRHRVDGDSASGNNHFLIWTVMPSSSTSRVNVFVRTPGQNPPLVTNDLLFARQPASCLRDTHHWHNVTDGPILALPIGMSPLMVIQATGHLAALFRLRLFRGTTTVLEIVALLHHHDGQVRT